MKRDLEDYRDLHREARQLHQAGDNGSSIECYSKLVYGLMESQGAAEGHSDLRNLLADSADELIAILRWEGRYDEAIVLAKRLVKFFPGRLLSLRMRAANLRIEGGEERFGLQELHQIAEREPENIWGWITLGTAYLWLTRYQEAEKQLRRAGQLDGAEDGDRATAYTYLFDLYDAQGRVEAAVEVWERGCQLDPALKVMLPEVVRMFIYWRRLNSAQEYLERETFRLRRLFYSGLITFGKHWMPRAVETWNKVLEYEPSQLSEGHDEFGEACIRLLRPSLALKALEPMIKRREVSYHRLLVAGLAWAQRRVINRAKRALEIALRMADLERPRRTRPAGGEGRILNARARILYGQIRLDSDIRQELDGYFIPHRLERSL